jgi:tetratricopeptide (TPR) repeat protein
LIDVEDWPAAIDAADHASALDSTDPWAQVLKGSALVEVGRPTEAVEAVEEALRIDPVGRQTLCEAVSVLCQAGEATRAARFADRAVELYPDDEDARVAHARVAECLRSELTIT